MILFTCQQWQAAHARAGNYILCLVEDELHSRTYQVALLPIKVIKIMLNSFNLSSLMLLCQVKNFVIIKLPVFVRQEVLRTDQEEAAHQPWLLLSWKLLQLTYGDLQKHNTVTIPNALWLFFLRVLEEKGVPKQPLKLETCKSYETTYRDIIRKISPAIQTSSTGLCNNSCVNLC